MAGPLDAADWTSSESLCLLPSGGPYKGEGLPELKSHVWLASSGSRSRPRLVAIEKRAILLAAREVNGFLGVQRGDRWLRTLPVEHVSGLSISARAHLTSSPVMDLGKWNVGQFFERLNYDRIRWTSLVPSQVFDLVQSRVVAPSFLKGVLVGGGELSVDLFEEARGLHWPLFPSFGMTETSAAAAIGVHPEKVKFLPHVEARNDSHQVLELKSDALFTAYYWLDEKKLENPKVDGWFKTSDRVDLRGGRVKFLGRVDDLIKIKGELISLPECRDLLQHVLTDRGISTGKGALLATEDKGAGLCVILVLNAELFSKRYELIDAYNQKAHPLARFHSVYFVSEFPLSDLGKLQEAQLKKSLML